MNWDEKYQKGEALWDKGAPAPAVEHGLDATGLDIAPTGVAEARAMYPLLANRFVTGNLFDPPEEMRGTYDVVLEHTCMSALPPTLRADYRRGIDLTLRRGGLLIGVWFIDPALDPGEVGPPFPFSVADLTALLRRVTKSSRIMCRMWLFRSRGPRAGARAAPPGRGLRASPLPGSSRPASLTPFFIPFRRN